MLHLSTMTTALWFLILSVLYFRLMHLILHQPEHQNIFVFRPPYLYAMYIPFCIIHADGEGKVGICHFCSNLFCVKRYFCFGFLG